VLQSCSRASCDLLIWLEGGGVCSQSACAQRCVPLLQPAGCDKTIWLPNPSTALFVLGRVFLCSDCELFLTLVVRLTAIAGYVSWPGCWVGRLSCFQCGSVRAASYRTCGVHHRFNPGGEARRGEQAMGF